MESTHKYPVKGKFSLLEADSFLFKLTSFGVDCFLEGETNRKSQKLFPFLEMAKKHGGVPVSEALVHIVQESKAQRLLVQIYLVCNLLGPFRQVTRLEQC